MDELRSRVTRAQQGDVDAFDSVVGEFQQVALNYARSILRDGDLAQDAVQDAFVQAYVNLPSLAEPAAFPAWLRTIVSRCCHRYLRGKRLPSVPLKDAEEVPSGAPTPSDFAESREVALRIHDAIRALPEHEQAVTRLFYIEDYSQREIAERLGLPDTTVNNRLHSSRQRLRRTMEAYAPMRERVKRATHAPTKSKEKQMALTYQATRRTLPKGEVELNIRPMTWDDMTAMRRLDDEIVAGLEFANAQRPPGGESYAGGPWADDEEIRWHYERYFSRGNMVLLAENESGKLVGFADLWVAREPEPFGDSLNLECVDFLWEYRGLGIAPVFLEEAEKVARAAGLFAVDARADGVDGDYMQCRGFGLRVFYEYDDVTCRCSPPPDWTPDYRPLPCLDYDVSGLIRVNHWCPTDFHGFAGPGRPGAQEFEVDGHRVVADFWRMWEPGYDVPTECQVFAPPEALNSTPLMSKILREVAFLAAEAGVEEVSLPCPSDLELDTSVVDVVNREFCFAWMRKQLG